MIYANSREMDSAISIPRPPDKSLLVRSERLLLTLKN